MISQWHVARSDSYSAVTSVKSPSDDKRSACTEPHTRVVCLAVDWCHDSPKILLNVEVINRSSAAAAC